MRTRGRKSSIRKEQDEVEDRIDVKLSTEKAVSCKISTTNSSDAATQTSDGGCQGKHDGSDVYKTENYHLMQAILGMSTELRALSTKILDMERVLASCVGVQDRWVNAMESAVAEAKVEDSDIIIMKSRGNQCPSTPPKITDPLLSPSCTATERESRQDSMVEADNRSENVASNQQADNILQEPERNVKKPPSANQNSRQNTPQSRAAKGGESPQRNIRQNKNTQSKFDDVDRNNKLSERKEKEKKSGNHHVSNDKQVLVLSDSVLNGINDQRLGTSYDFNCTIKNCYTSSEIESSFKDELGKNGKPQITVLHVGINDLKKSSPQEASKAFVKAARCIKNICPESKLIISSVVPVSNDDLEVKRDAFNAINKAELIHEKGISFMTHENLDALSYRFMNKDGIHPTRDGASILARNLGRGICNVLWKSVHSRGRKVSSKNYYHNPSKPLFQGPTFHGPPSIPLRNRFSPLSNQ